MPGRARVPDGPFESLLAIDLGLRTGLAIFGNDGRLQRYRSQHYATQGTLRRAVPGILEAAPSVTALVIEGGGALLGVWEREAARRHLDVIRVTADEWRPALLLPREQRSSSVAKRTAGELARRVIAWSGAPRPTSLRHDTAEAILIGLWGTMRLGWLDVAVARSAVA
ncbi:MAG: hypothetical protein JWN79_2438 [Gemmatimonadetes bacterium]|nr:hypothetical protein [Gemmatimonadota bacterium]